MNSVIFVLKSVSRGLIARDEGQDLVEYALLLSLIALGCIVGIGSIATAVTSVFSNVSNSLV